MADNRHPRAPPARSQPAQPRKRRRSASAWQSLATVEPHTFLPSQTRTHPQPADANAAANGIASGRATGMGGTGTGVSFSVMHVTTTVDDAWPSPTPFLRASHAPTADNADTNENKPRSSYVSNTAATITPPPPPQASMTTAAANADGDVHANGVSTTPLVVTKADLRAARKDLGMVVTPKTTPSSSSSLLIHTPTASATANGSTQTPTPMVFLDSEAAHAARLLLSSTRRQRDRQQREQQEQQEQQEQNMALRTVQQQQQQERQRQLQLQLQSPALGEMQAQVNGQAQGRGQREGKGKEQGQIRNCHGIQSRLPNSPSDSPSPTTRQLTRGRNGTSIGSGTGAIVGADAGGNDGNVKREVQEKQQYQQQQQSRQNGERDKYEHVAHGDSAADDNDNEPGKMNHNNNCADGGKSGDGQSPFSSFHRLRLPSEDSESNDNNALMTGVTAAGQDLFGTGGNNIQSRAHMISKGDDSGAGDDNITGAARRDNEPVAGRGGERNNSTGIGDDEMRTTNLNPNLNVNVNVMPMMMMMTPMANKRRLSTGSAVTPLALNFESPPGVSADGGVDESAGSAGRAVDYPSKHKNDVNVDDTNARSKSQQGAFGATAAATTRAATAMDGINHVRQTRPESRPFIVVPSPTTPATTAFTNGRGTMRRNNRDNHDSNLFETLQSPSPSVRHARRDVTENGRDHVPTRHYDHDKVRDCMNNGNNKIIPGVSIRSNNDKNGNSTANGNGNGTMNDNVDVLRVTTKRNENTAATTITTANGVDRDPGNLAPPPLFMTGRGVVLPVAHLNTKMNLLTTPATAPTGMGLTGKSLFTTAHGANGATGMVDTTTPMLLRGRKRAPQPQRKQGQDAVQRSLFQTTTGDASARVANDVNEETPLLLRQTSGENMCGASSNVAQQRDEGRGQGHGQISLFTTGGGKHIPINDALLNNGRAKAVANILVQPTEAADKPNNISDTEKKPVGPPLPPPLELQHMEVQPALFTTGKGKALAIDPSKGRAILYGDGNENGCGGGTSTAVRGRRKSVVGFAIDQSDNGALDSGDGAKSDSRSGSVSRSGSGLTDRAKRLFQTPSIVRSRPLRQHADATTPSSSEYQSILRHGGGVALFNSGNGGPEIGVTSADMPTPGCNHVTRASDGTTPFAGAAGRGRGRGHLLKGLAVARGGAALAASTTTPSTDGLRKTLFRESSSRSKRRLSGGITNTPFKRPRMISPVNNHNTLLTVNGVTRSGSGKVAKAARKVQRVAVPKLRRDSGRITCCTTMPPPTSTTAPTTRSMMIKAINTSDDGECQRKEGDQENGNGNVDEPQAQQRRHVCRHFEAVLSDQQQQNQQQHRENDGDDTDDEIELLYKHPGCMWRCLRHTFNRARYGHVSCLPPAVACAQTLWGGDTFGVEQCMKWITSNAMFGQPAAVSPKGAGTAATCVGSEAWVKLSYVLAVNKLARLHFDLLKRRARARTGRRRDDSDGNTDIDTRAIDMVVEVFSAANVVREFLRRVEYEWHCSRQTGLLRMLRRDTNPASHIVVRLLDVAYIQMNNSEDRNDGGHATSSDGVFNNRKIQKQQQHLESTVTDGWYVARVRMVDDKLRKRIMTGWLQLGDSFHMCGATLVTASNNSASNKTVYDDGDELDASLFQVAKNHVFRCRKGQSTDGVVVADGVVRLGLRRMLAVGTIGAVCENGGSVQMMKLIVVRAYHPVYMEHVEDAASGGGGSIDNNANSGRKTIIWRRQHQEELARDAFQRARQERMTKKIDRRQRRRIQRKQKQKLRTRSGGGDRNDVDDDNDDDDDDNDEDDDDDQTRNVTCIQELKVCGVDDYLRRLEEHRQQGAEVDWSLDVKLLRVYRGSEELSELVLRHDVRFTAGSGCSVGTSSKVVCLQVGYVTPRRQFWSCRGENIVTSLLPTPASSSNTSCSAVPHMVEQLQPRLVTLSELMNNNNNIDLDFNGVFYTVYAHRGSAQSFLYVSDNGVNVLAIELWSGDADDDALLQSSGNGSNGNSDTGVHRHHVHQVIGITDFTWQGHNQMLNLGQARTTARSAFVFMSGTKKKNKKEQNMMQQRMKKMQDALTASDNNSNNRNNSRSNNRSKKSTTPCSAGTSAMLAQLQVTRDAVMAFVSGKRPSITAFYSSLYPSASPSL